MKKKGFEREKLKTSEGIICDVYWRNHCNVIRNQICPNLAKQMNLKPFSAQQYSFPVNHEICNKVDRAAEIAIAEKMDRNVSWKVEKKGDAESSIGCIQLFGDKFHVSLRAGAPVFTLLM